MFSDGIFNYYYFCIPAYISDDIKQWINVNTFLSTTVGFVFKTSGFIRKSWIKYQFVKSKPSRDPEVGECVTTFIRVDKALRGFQFVRSGEFVTSCFYGWWANCLTSGLPAASHGDLASEANESSAGSGLNHTHPRTSWILGPSTRDLNRPKLQFVSSLARARLRSTGNPRASEIRWNGWFLAFCTACCRGEWVSEFAGINDHQSGNEPDKMLNYFFASQSKAGASSRFSHQVVFFCWIFNNRWKFLIVIGHFEVGKSAINPPPPNKPYTSISSLDRVGGHKTFTQHFWYNSECSQSHSLFQSQQMFSMNLVSLFFITNVTNVSGFF